MDFICPVCHKKIPYELHAINSHTERHIVDEIKKKHPEWVEGDGMCGKCYDYYKKQLRV
jgi:hypothetical protein